MPRFTLIIPYYRNPEMLQRQVREWLEYPREIKFIVVDDGSPEPALPFLHAALTPSLRDRLRLYRIKVDIPWNRGGARNLGSFEASDDWILHVDIDHLLPAEDAASLVSRRLESEHWYRFARRRVGKADETRKKDRIPADAEGGEIHPHGDSYLCQRALYWRVGGYDEDYSGCLGGGSPFLHQLERAAPVKLLTDVHLSVHTRDAIPDASDLTLPRDRTEYSRRRRDKERRGATAARNPLRFPWERVL